MISKTRIALLLATGLALAQSFEVASIRPHQGVIRMVGRTMSGSQVTISAYTVRDLIMDAYNIKDYQVDGASGWMIADTERYDMAARVAGESAPTTEQVRPLLQTLLAERFQFKFHRETREIPVYALVVGKNGPKLKENSSGGPMMRMGNQGQDTLMTYTGAPLDMLARQLTAVLGVGRPVLDKTGLAGKFDFQLRLRSFQMRMTPDPAAAAVTGPSGESIFTAIEEQLGLKLESQKAPIEVLVIDHVERPSEN